MNTEGLRWYQRLQISGKERQDWYRALARATAAGIPLNDLLASMERDFIKTRHPMTPLIRELRWRLRGGGPAHEFAGDRRQTLGTELAGLVPAAEAMLIQAGLSSGRLPEGLDSAARLIAAHGRLRSLLARSMVRPASYLLALAGLLLFFGEKLFPSFAQTRPRAEWPEYAKLLGFIADHVTVIVAAVLGGVTLGAALLSMLAPRWTGDAREWADRRLFPFTLIAAVTGAMMLTALAAYIGAGMPFSAALSSLRDVSNPYLASQYDNLRALLRRGVGINDALNALSVVHPRYHWIVNVYGLSGDAAIAYNSIAQEMLDRTEAFIVAVVDRVVSNALLVLVGGMLMWIYMSMYGIVMSGGAAH